MGNASGKAEDDDEEAGAENGGGEAPMRPGFPPPVRRARSADSMGGCTPPQSPRRSRAPLMFAPQVPVAPLHNGVDAPPIFNQIWVNESHGPPLDAPLEKGIPTLITWNYGGHDVFVEGSWDNWTTRRVLQKSGKDYSILLVLPSGVYQYKFIVDGEWRYIPDLPCVADQMGHIANLLDVHACPLADINFDQWQENVPENLESVSEFEPPPSPAWSYGNQLPSDEDFSKDPPGVPPQLHLTVLGMQNSEDAPVKPQHAVLNHLFIERGSGSQSLVTLGLTHRYQSKYVTVVLYKPTRS